MLVSLELFGSWQTVSVGDGHRDLRGSRSSRSMDRSPNEPLDVGGMTLI
jgi:hypothetical protein